MSRNKLWKNDKVQFARLICELVANCEDKESKTIRAVADAMDLRVDDIDELLDRAGVVWEKAKAKI